MSTEDRYQGSCLCGAIQVSATGKPFSVHLCHCTTCKKVTGSDFGSFAMFPKANVTLTASDPSLLRVYEDGSSNSGIINDRSFCGKCGSNVRNEHRGWTDYAVIPTGLIEGGKESLKPMHEFFCIRRAGWLGDAGPTTRYDTIPAN
ncbi:hypothetical protein GQ53DRAFT_735399 [Thozetella sp. PMI_491]|nr:hypothetical protein GQ53DRAFT_735399 [Thozetella sp. PMI_491]